MLRKALWLQVFLFFTTAAFSQNSSCNLQISVLTCSPGNELYSLFGHTALRIHNLEKGTDVIYNWGTFDFDEPNFYIKFMRGKLPYFVSTDSVPAFLYVYQYEGRSVIEQVLHLSCEEKMQIKHSVDSNMVGDNRFYKYDFLFDNCTTRIRDIIYGNLTSAKVSGNMVPHGTTFRNMIYHYLNYGGQPWSKLGIDILLGATVDRPVTDYEAMFLPDYLMKAFDSSSAEVKPVVAQKKLILAAQRLSDPSNKDVPLTAISIICGLLFLISFLKTSWATSVIKIADSFFLYITGIIGLLIMFMWFFTDHVACSDNYNLLWAVPSNAIIGFLVLRKPVWINKYFMIISLVTAFTLISWMFLPQHLNTALIPLILLLFYRYVRLGFVRNVQI